MFFVILSNKGAEVDRMGPYSHFESAEDIAQLLVNSIPKDWPPMQRTEKCRWDDPQGQGTSVIIGTSLF